MTREKSGSMLRRTRGESRRGHGHAWPTHVREWPRVRVCALERRRGPSVVCSSIDEAPFCWGLINLGFFIMGDRSSWDSFASDVVMPDVATEIQRSHASCHCGSSPTSVGSSSEANSSFALPLMMRMSGKWRSRSSVVGLLITSAGIMTNASDGSTSGGLEILG